MRVAEVYLNHRATFKTNDAEHKAFCDACIDNGLEMSEVLRKFTRDYVKRHKAKK